MIENHPDAVHELTNSLVKSGKFIGTSVTTAAFFLLALLVPPLILIVPAAATAPALVVVGVAGQAAGRSWRRGMTVLAPVVLGINGVLLFGLALRQWSGIE